MHVEFIHSKRLSQSLENIISLDMMLKLLTSRVVKNPTVFHGLHIPV
jgi:hypothetical protein